MGKRNNKRAGKSTNITLNWRSALKLEPLDIEFEPYHPPAEEYEAQNEGETVGKEQVGVVVEGQCEMMQEDLTGDQQLEMEEGVHLVDIEEGERPVDVLNSALNSLMTFDESFLRKVRKEIRTLRNTNDKWRRILRKCPLAVNFLSDLFRE